MWQTRSSLKVFLQSGWPRRAIGAWVSNTGAYRKDSTYPVPVALVFFCIHWLFCLQIITYSAVPQTTVPSWDPGPKAFWLLPPRSVALSFLLWPLLLHCWQHPGLPGWSCHPHDGGLHAAAVVGVSAWHCALWVAVRGEGTTPKRKRAEPGLWEGIKHLPGFRRVI